MPAYRVLASTLWFVLVLGAGWCLLVWGMADMSPNRFLTNQVSYTIRGLMALIWFFAQRTSVAADKGRRRRYFLTQR